MTPVTKAFKRLDRDVYTNPESDPTLGKPIETKKMLERSLKVVGAPLKAYKPSILRPATSMSAKQAVGKGLRRYQRASQEDVLGAQSSMIDLTVWCQNKNAMPCSSLQQLSAQKSEPYVSEPIGGRPLKKPDSSFKKYRSRGLDNPHYRTSHLVPLRPDSQMSENDLRETRPVTAAESMGRSSVEAMKIPFDHGGEIDVTKMRFKTAEGGKRKRYVEELARHELLMRSA